jgi:hypothetical protein
MSSYLLLRNNKESGPYTMDEIKGMSLKPYDLLWVVGKSAAWRYPGEITELKSFAPPVPEGLNDPFNKKRGSDNFTITKKDELGNSGDRDNNSQRVAPARSVYVNLPAEKKTANRIPSIILFDEESFPSTRQEPSYEFSNLYKKPVTRAVRFSGKVVWIATIVLLFGAGILTGLFISDRRKFFTTDANHPQAGSSVQPTVLTINKKFLPSETDLSDSLKAVKPVKKKLLTATGQKTSQNDDLKKDSLDNQNKIISSMKLNDSLKQNAISNTEILYQKIKSQPENYINLVTGRYSTGVFGGISSFPVSVTNNSTVIMDLVIVNIDYIQNNQKVFKTESLSFSDLPPGETVTLKAPKSPRGIKIATRIQLVNPRQLDPGSSN